MTASYGGLKMYFLFFTDGKDVMWDLNCQQKSNKERDEESIHTYIYINKCLSINYNRIKSPKNIFLKKKTKINANFGKDI